MNIFDIMRTQYEGVLIDLSGEELLGADSLVLSEQGRAINRKKI